MDLYFEAYSGIAGDMIIASLLDLGASKEKLIKGIESLNLKGYEIEIKKIKKNGILATKFDVNLLHHHHEHRHLSDIIKIINDSNLDENIKTNAINIFNIIARAESLAHGVDIDEVHFHEVGAIDSIIDIVGACILIDDLKPQNIYRSQIFEGIGFTNCAHGSMPVPVPAVINILSQENIEINIIDENGEHITPTGIAILSYFSKEMDNKNIKFKKIGIGAGTKDFIKTTNILRVMLIQSKKKA